MSQQAMHTHTTAPFSGSVGWCGLGAMGAAMAPRLLAVTDRLSGYDINKDAGQNLGLQRAEQLAELATTDIVITMLPDGRAVREVAETLLAAGFSGLLADMSSCHPQDSRVLLLIWRPLAAGLLMRLFQAGGQSCLRRADDNGGRGRNRY